MAVTSAEDNQLSPKPTEAKRGENLDGVLDKLSGNNTDGNAETSGEVSAGDPESSDKTTESSATEGAADSDSDTDDSDDEQEEMSGDDEKDTINKGEDEESNGEEAKEEDTNEEDVTKKKDDLNDNPQVLDPDSITDDSDARFHTVKLMLYIVSTELVHVVPYCCFLS